MRAFSNGPVKEAEALRLLQDASQNGPEQAESREENRALDTALLRTINFDSARDPESGAVSLSAARALIEDARAQERALLQTRAVAGAEGLITGAGGLAPDVQNSVSGVGGVGGGGFYGGSSGGSSGEHLARAREYQHHRDKHHLWARTVEILDSAERWLHDTSAEPDLVRQDMSKLTEFALGLQAAGQSVSRIENFIERAVGLIERVHTGNGGQAARGEPVGTDWVVTGISLTNWGPSAEVQVGFNDPSR